MLIIDILPITVTANVTSGNTIYVDDDNIDGPWDGTIEHPYQHIQDAIDATENGDTIYVYGGTYYENIVVNKSVELIGENKETTIIDGQQLGHVITLFADFVTIYGFTIQNSKEKSHGININTSSYCNIERNILKNNYVGIGMHDYDSNNLIITNNSIISNDLGILLTCENHTVSYNNVSNNDQGIYMLSDNTIVKENTFIDNDMGLCAVKLNLHFYSLFGTYKLKWKLDIHHNNFISNNIHAEFETLRVNGIFLFVWFDTSINQPQFISFLPDHTDNKLVIPLKINYIPKMKILKKSETPVPSDEWNNNYWDDYNGSGPQVIKGWNTHLFILGLCNYEHQGIPFPTVNFDWHPASEPYDI